ncbi:GntR family transcriptional regulator [Oscillospiraceae bacterium WX1]
MLLQLQLSSPIPIYLQIRNQIVLGIADGRLAPGEKLPTIRALADASGVNMMTVSKAYQLLKREGHITADRRSGAVIVGGDRDQSDMPEHAQQALKLLISEAKLRGMSKAAFQRLCGDLFDKMEVD